VTYRTKQVGVILTLLAMASFVAWPFWKAWYFNIASAALQDRAKQLVQNNPSLQTAWDVALADGMLTEPEARLIVEGAGEKFGTQE
jgi:hypothetical protein